MPTLRARIRTQHPAAGTGRRRRVVRRPVDPTFQRLAKRWDEVCRDPFLANAPYKVETTVSGNLLMSPASNRHSVYRGRILHLLRLLLPSGESIPECSVATSAGVRVADVAWMSDEFFKQHAVESLYAVAPELCVEVLSPGNSADEIREKTELYLAKGAREVWLCSDDGLLTFHDHQGALKRSVLCPKFPVRI